MTRRLRPVICGIFGGVTLLAAPGCVLTERIMARLTPVATQAADEAQTIVLDELIAALEELRE